jgi:hypothetical protein
MIFSKLVNVRWVRRSLLIGLHLAILTTPHAAESAGPKFNVIWRERPADGTIEVANGRLAEITLAPDAGNVEGARFQFKGSGAGQLGLALADAQLGPGGGATIVTIDAGKHPFSFFARDITTQFPVFLPAEGVAVTPAGDKRTFAEISSAITGRRLESRLEQMEREPESSFASASSITRNQHAPIWLGLGRDTRLFKITPAVDGSGLEYDVIRTTRASAPVVLPELKDRPATYGYTEGRGQGPVVDTKRSLEDGCLPILHKIHEDGDIRYHTTTFVTLEVSALNRQNVRGTSYVIADTQNAGTALTEEQRRHAAELLAAAGKPEEVVLYVRVEASNTAKVPRYAWIKAPKPGTVWNERYAYTFDGKSGFSRYADDRVFCVSLLNGKPFPQEEIAVLLQPGETMNVDFRLPHEPISAAAAAVLATQDYQARHTECRNFWQSKLADAARIDVPEKRVTDMVRAGLLHLDLITYGSEPDGVLAPSIGVYAPIGTESAPIIQFYDSLGLHDIARRSLQYFLEKQRPDGLIQNFGGYMVETGAVLWSIGEHYRYTHDDAWITAMKPKILKSCEYLLNWRVRNQKPGLEGRGYGMLDGKVADPEDPYHQFMLNAYGYLGLSRIAEILTSTDPERGAQLRHEADAWKADIRKSLDEAMKLSPVIPLGNGAWTRTAPPWTETRGPRTLYATGEKQFTHGSFNAADSLLGPLHLVFCEVLDPMEPTTTELLNYQTELLYQENTGFSQPYYSRHDCVQLKRGLVKPFLKTWYTSFSALADRETYTFWEHLHHVSEHKTHEEAWFLLQTRWMLYLEENDTLDLLSGIPRAWMADGQSISLDRVASYFGPLSLSVHSHVGTGSIDAEVTCDGERHPQQLRLRLPHPDGRHPRKVTGGIYDSATESVVINAFTGKATVRVEY